MVPSGQAGGLLAKRGGSRRTCWEKPGEAELSTSISEHGHKMIGGFGRHSGHSKWTHVDTYSKFCCRGMSICVTTFFLSSYVFWKRCWFTRVQNLCLHPKLNRDPSMEIASSIDHERMKSMCRTRWNKYVQGRDHRCPKETIQIEYVYIFYISMQDSWWRKRELGKKWIDMANPPLVLPSILDAAGKEYLDHSARLDLDVSHWII